MIKVNYWSLNGKMDEYKVNITFLNQMLLVTREYQTNMRAFANMEIFLMVD